MYEVMLVFTITMAIDHVHKHRIILLAEHVHKLGCLRVSRHGRSITGRCLWCQLRQHSYTNLQRFWHKDYEALCYQVRMSAERQTWAEGSNLNHVPNEVLSIEFCWTRLNATFGKSIGLRLPLCATIYQKQWCTRTLPLTSYPALLHMHVPSTQYTTSMWREVGYQGHWFLGDFGSYMSNTGDKINIIVNTIIIHNIIIIMTIYLQHYD